MDSKSKQAASQFNAYQKSKESRLNILLKIELGLNDKVVNDKYLGAIFTKQQSGFDPAMLDKMKPLIPVNVTDDPSKSLKCGPADFDPFIKFGRDN